MPFQSEKQRRYLWANEPEIARDWTDTYGSRIQNNTGGITRLGYAEGPKPIRPVPGGPVYRVNEEEEEEENPLQKFISMMQGNAGRLNKADITANTDFLQNYGVGGGNISFAANNPYQMTSGPFQGMNAPGSSAHGSKTSAEMAGKWLEKYGDIQRTPGSPMADKRAGMVKMAGPGKEDYNSPQHPGKATGGIMRLGYANGPAGGASAGGDYGGNVNPQQEYAGRTFQETYGGPYQDQIMQGGTGIKPEPKKSGLKNLLGMGIEGLRKAGPFLGKKAPWVQGALSIYDYLQQPPKDEDLILSADETNETNETNETEDQEVQSPTLGSHLLHKGATARQIEKDAAMAALYASMGWKQ